MLSRFELKLTGTDDLNVNCGSLFHGALMEIIDKEYAAKLHENSLKPFSLSVHAKDGEATLIINCLNKECADVFTRPLMSADKLTLKHKDLTLKA